MKILHKIYAVIEWQGILCFFIMVGIYIWSDKKAKSLDKKAAYTKGVSLGLMKGARGTYYLHYNFLTNTGYHEGSVSSNFYKYCQSCLHIGDTVIVMYDKTDADNSNLLDSLPAGMVLDDDAPNHN